MSSDTLLSLRKDGKTACAMMTEWNKIKRKKRHMKLDKKISSRIKTNLIQTFTTISLARKIHTHTNSLA